MRRWEDGEGYPSLGAATRASAISSSSPSSSSSASPSSRSPTAARRPPPADLRTDIGRASPPTVARRPPTADRRPPTAVDGEDVFVAAVVAACREAGVVRG